MSDPNDHRWIPPDSSDAPPPRTVVELVRPHATFISQLIAEHQHLPPQRERRRAPPAMAAFAYAQTADQATPRLPPGYRRRLDA